VFFLYFQWTDAVGMAFEGRLNSKKFQSSSLKVIYCYSRFMFELFLIILG